MIADPVFCRGGKKIRHRSLAAARVRARMMADELHGHRVIVETIYAYKCTACNGFHLSRQNRRSSILVYEAAPPEIQRWGWRRR